VATVMSAVAAPPFVAAATYDAGAPVATGAPVVGRAMLRQRREAKRRRLFVFGLAVLSLVLLVALAVVIF